MTNVRAPKLFCFFFYSETERHCHFHEPQQICFLRPCDDNEDKWVPGMKVKPHEDYSAPQPRMHVRSQEQNPLTFWQQAFLCASARVCSRKVGGRGGGFRRGIICLCIRVLWNVPLFALRRQKPNVSAESVVSRFIICISCHLINLQPLEASTEIYQHFQCRSRWRNLYFLSGHHRGTSFLRVVNICSKSLIRLYSAGLCSPKNSSLAEYTV